MRVALLHKATRCMKTPFYPLLLPAIRNIIFTHFLSHAKICIIYILSVLPYSLLMDSITSAFQEFKARISCIPTIHKFLQPGSQRKPPLDEVSTETVKNIFKFERGIFLKNMGTIVAEYQQAKSSQELVYVSLCFHRSAQSDTIRPL